MDDIQCGLDDPGWWGKEWEEGKRLARLACYKTKGTPNYHMQPLEGIHAGMPSDRNWCCCNAQSSFSVTSVQDDITGMSTVSLF